MKPAPIPVDDGERVADLHALNILDTKREERFDRITDLVADVFGVKMCFINMVDARRQWFKSTCGLQGVDETSRELGFCAHAIFEPEVMIVPDATKDSRFSDNPFVTGEFGLRFYAGSVLRGPAGKPVGTLCLVDTTAREFSSRQADQLKKFAALVQAELLRSA
jgi:GAF domain-containing protein